MKKNLYGLVAVVIAVASFAFTSVPKASKAILAEQWFVYTGDVSGNSFPVNISQALEPGNYEALPGAPSCNATSHVCSIRAFETVNGNDIPNLSSGQTINTKLTSYFSGTEDANYIKELQ